MTAPTIAEQIARVKYLLDYFHEDREPELVAILASLEKLQAIESQPVPVEPDVVKRIRLLSVIEYIDALKAKLQAAQQELLDTTWQDHADHWKKRAEQAEKDRDICYISLQDMRRRLHEIASLVTDPRLDEKHTA